MGELEWTDDCGHTKVYGGGASGIGHFYGVAYMDGGYGVHVSIGETVVDEHDDYGGGKRTQAEAMVAIEKWVAERFERVRAAVVSALASAPAGEGGGKHGQ